MAPRTDLVTEGVVFGLLDDRIELHRHRPRCGASIREGEGMPPGHEHDWDLREVPQVAVEYLQFTVSG